MSSEKALDHYRLPTDLRPRHYDLTIRTDLEKERFFGFVKIECVMFFILSLQTILTCFQPRYRESDQGRHLQCRRGAEA
jgi:hypothetical protein